MGSHYYIFYFIEWSSFATWKSQSPRHSWATIQDFYPFDQAKVEGEHGDNQGSPGSPANRSSSSPSPVLRGVNEEEISLAISPILWIYIYILDCTSIQMYSVHYVFVIAYWTYCTLSIYWSIHLFNIYWSISRSVRMYALPTSVKSFEILKDIIRYDSEQRRKSFGASKNLGVIRSTEVSLGSKGVHALLTIWLTSCPKHDQTHVMSLGP